MSRRPLALLAALLFALPPGARAAVVEVAPMFPAASAPWAGAIGGALTASAMPLAPALVPLASSPAPAAAYAPLVAQLEGSLHLTPAELKAMPPADARTALELAAEAAHEDLAQRTYELSAQARALSAPGRAMDRRSRAELYRVVARLDELRGRYGPYLGDAERAEVQRAWTEASGRAWQVRTELLGERGRSLTESFAGAGRDMPAAAQAAAEASLPPGSPGAVKLLERMRASKHGWGADDLDTLLTGFGFERRDGGKHRIYTHPDYPQLHETVSHQRDLPPGYVQTAIKDIEELGRLRAAAAGSAAGAPAADAPPAEIRLADLAVLVAPPKERKAPKAPKIAQAPARAPPKAEAKPAPAPAPAPEPAPEKEPLVTLQPATPRAAPAPGFEPPAPEVPSRPSLTPKTGWLRRLLGL
jgi:hypothetical protein